MKKPTAQEIKRKIDSKIFELQSLLLSEDAGAVDEALLRECAAWFRPQHLQDIVIERSEAEGRCGWPGCGKKLPRWRLALPMVFDLPEGEQLGRFCERACMAKTNIYLAAIPPTPPHSRENLVRLVCPPPTAASEDKAKGGGAAGAKEGGAKKVYKRPRRRDIPPSKKPPAGVSPAGVAAPKAGNGKDMSADQLPGDGEEKKQAAQTKAEAVVVVSATDGEEKKKIDKTGGNHAEAGQAAKTEAEASTGGNAVAGVGGGSGDAGDGAGKSTGSEVGGCEDESAADGTAAVRAALEKVSISEQEGGEPSSAEFTPAAVVRNGGAAPKPAVPPATTAAAVVPVSTPVAPSTDWENLRFSRASGGGASTPSSSVVSLHASLAAAAAETAAAIRTPGAAALNTGYSGSGIAPGPEQTRNGDDGDDDSAPRIPQEAALEAASSSPSPARRKSVSFADGTKEDPLPGAVSIAPKPSARGNAAAKKQAAAATRTGQTPGTRRRGGAGGRSSGRSAAGRGRGGKATPAAPRKHVLGGVVERAPTVPTPIEPKVGGRANAGMVEGHLPKIEADLSFRVMPRGGYPGLGGGAAAGAGDSLGNYGLGVDGGPLTGDEIEEEAEEGEEDEGSVGGEVNENDADENDRAIWRETFGEEMPAEVAAESWIDMDAIRDKEMREEFASSIAPSTLLWSALSEWVTAETRAVCRAGRSAAAKVQAAAATAAAMPAIAAESGEGKDVNSSSSSTTTSTSGNSSSDSSGVDQQRRRGSLPPDLEARRAGAVAEAIENEARRHARHGRGSITKPGKEAGSSGNGPTLTGALRHSGVSAMVNMHLSQAERALRTAAVGNNNGGGGGNGGWRGLPRAAGEGGGGNNAGSRTKWVWSDTADKARQGARVPGGWVEEDEAAAVAAAAVPLVAKNQAAANNGNVVAPSAAPAAVAAAAQDASAEATRDTAEAGEHRSAEKENKDRTPAAVVAASEPVPVGGAGCRRAVAALIDTLDAESASAAANLSIAQWKVVSLVLLTAAGLGAGAVGQGGGDTADGSERGGGGAEAAVVGSEEAGGGAKACVRLCGPELSLSESEFRILVEVMLDE